MEVLTMFILQPVQALLHSLGTIFCHVMEWSATERSKARSKDHPGIHEIFVSYNFLTQTSD